MQIYLLRHGESDANVQGVISDDPSQVFHLTPMGIAQAEIAAEELADVPFTHVYVSEHMRTRETAEVLVKLWLEAAAKKAEKAKKTEKSKDEKEKKDEAEENGTTEAGTTEAGQSATPQREKYPISVDARLNERRSGMSGQPVSAFDNLVKPDPVHIKPEGGESFLEQMERVREFMDAVAERHVDCIVLAVSHENPILAAQAVAGRSSEESAKDDMANCEWVKVEWPPAEKPGKNGKKE